LRDDAALLLLVPLLLLLQPKDLASQFGVFHLHLLPLEEALLELRELLH
jgi:hypothetical protein